MTSSNTFLDLFITQRPFSLDPFQIEACTSIEQGRGVLVCAPTGSGKTIVGEFAIFLALRTGKRCFYTTPIKALSNQKYADLVQEYDADTVGLLTGDQTINPDAEIVVMTTEVLRNMIYAQSDNLDRLQYVVMDEIHFLSDRSRGAVWEEVILNLDESIKVIGLSATVSNSEEFGDWLRTVRGDTDVILSDHRPIPLTQWALIGQRLLPLLDGPDPNPRIDRYAEKAHPPHYSDVIELLGAKDMLPAIFFIFSRKGCDKAMHRVRLCLTTKEEQRTIRAFAEKELADVSPEDRDLLNYRSWLNTISRGIAAHHAGMLPAFRHVVEKLFAQGLIKVVFATETLALGINMPARTVFLSSLVKFNGEAHVDLTPGQYTQLTGRAGRRGIDTQGNSVIQWDAHFDSLAVAGLASTRMYPLHSTFVPGYNMSINLLATLGYEAARTIIGKSFAQFQADKELVAQAQALTKAEKAVEEASKALRTACLDYAYNSPTITDADQAVETFFAYSELRTQQAEEEKHARLLAQKHQQAHTEALFASLRHGDVIAIPARKTPMLAVVQETHPYLVVLMENGWSGTIFPEDFAVAPIKVGFLQLAKRHILLRALRRSHFPKPKRMKTKPKAIKTDKLSMIRAQMAKNPCHYWPNKHKLDRLADTLRRAQKQEKRLATQIEEQGNSLGATFDKIIQLLQEMDYITEDHRITDNGQRLAKIHNDSDLLMSECVRRQVWKELDPAELAGLVSLCCFENRSDKENQIIYPTIAMEEAAKHTMRIWEEIYSNELRYALNPSMPPDGTFALVIHQWTAGAPLEYCLEAAARCGLKLTAGDFVRQCRIIIDNLEQVVQTTPTMEIKRNASAAIESIKRGVVEL